MPKTAAHPGRAVVMIGLAQIIDGQPAAQPPIFTPGGAPSAPATNRVSRVRILPGDHEDRLDGCLTSVNLRHPRGAAAESTGVASFVGSAKYVQ